MKVSLGLKLKTNNNAKKFYNFFICTIDFWNWLVAVRRIFSCEKITGKTQNERFRI